MKQYQLILSDQRKRGNKEKWRDYLKSGTVCGSRFVRQGVGEYHLSVWPIKTQKFIKNALRKP